MDPRQIRPIRYYEPRPKPPVHHTVCTSGDFEADDERERDNNCLIF